jgi:hypothetical protein
MGLVCLQVIKIEGNENIFHLIKIQPDYSKCDFIPGNKSSAKEYP